MAMQPWRVVRTRNAPSHPKSNSCWSTLSVRWGIYRGVRWQNERLGQVPASNWEVLVPALLHFTEPRGLLTLQGESKLAKHASRCDCSNGQNKWRKQVQSGRVKCWPCGDDAKKAAQCRALQGNDIFHTGWHQETHLVGPIIQRWECKFVRQQECQIFVSSWKRTCKHEVDVLWFFVSDTFL